jgi:hypothetical protein
VLKEIADSCGFKSADAMRRTFLRALGVTAAEYASRFKGTLYARHSHGLRCPKTPSCSLFRSLAGAFPKIDRALLRIAINLPQLCLRKLELPNRVKLYALFYPIVRIYSHMIQNSFLASSNADMDGLEIPLDCL